MVKKYLGLILVSIFVASFLGISYGEELLSFSLDKIVIEEPDDVFYINIVNQSSKETILYEIDEFPEFLNIDPLEGRIFPLGEERLKVKFRRSAKFEKMDGEIVFIYAKKTSPRNLIYKRIKVEVNPLTSISTPTPTPIPSPSPTPSPTPTPTPSPTPTSTPTPTPTPMPSPSPTSTPTSTPTPTPSPTPTPVPLSIEIKDLGPVEKRPEIYKEGVGFVFLEDEIAVGETVKFQAIFDKDLFPSLDVLSWEVDPQTEVVKVEGDLGDIIYVKRNKVGTGHLTCKIFDKAGNVIGEGDVDFDVTVSAQALEDAKKLREEIAQKLKDAKAFYNERNLSDAKRLYSEVLSLDPQNKDAKYGISRVEKAERTQKKVLSIYGKAKYYLNKGDIKNAYLQIMTIGNYMWAFPKDDPIRKKVSSLKQKIISLYRPTSGKIRKYKAPGTNTYIYTGKSSNISLFSRNLGGLLVRKSEIPGFDTRYAFYAYDRGIIVKELKTGRWEGLYKDTKRTYTLDLAFLKVLSVNKGLIGQMGKGRTPGIMLFKGRLKVQIFDNGVMIYETNSNTLWYTLF